IGIVTSLFISCSDENGDNQSPDDNTLLVQMTETVGSDSSTSTFEYNGNKIVSQTDDVKSISYEYTGNLITKRTFQAFDSPDHKSEQIYQYSANNQLSQVVELFYYGPNAPQGFKYVFTNNGNNTISYNKYQGDLVNQDNYVGSGTYHFNADGEVQQIVQNDINAVAVATINFTYDTHHAPFSNVVGYDKLFYINDGKHRNIISITTEVDDDALSTTHAYLYNADDYPSDLEITFTENDGTPSTKTVEYFYN